MRKNFHQIIILGLTCSALALCGTVTAPQPVYAAKTANETTSENNTIKTDSSNNDSTKPDETNSDSSKEDTEKPDSSNEDTANPDSSTDNTSGNDSSDQANDSAETIQKVKVTDKVAKRAYTKKKKISHTYTYHLPVLKGKTDGIKKINSFYKNQRTEEIQSFKDYINEGTLGVSITDELTYEVTYNKNGYISILQSGYMYAGGAHGMPYRIAHTFDLNTGKEITLKDIFDLKESELTAKIARAFNKTIKADPDGGYWTDEFGGSAIKTVKKTAGYNSPFYLTKKGVCLYYNPYDLACYARGFVEATLRFSANKSLLKLDLLAH